jgi:hypothetical protein
MPTYSAFAAPIAASTARSDGCAIWSRVGPGSTSRLAYDSRSILRFKSFQKTHLYARRARHPAANDGDPAVTRDMLR